MERQKYTAQQLIDMVHGVTPLIPEHYPALAQLSGVSKECFIIGHSLRHLSKSIGKMHGVIEAAEHGESIDIKQLKEKVFAAGFSLCKLCAVLGINGEELVGGIYAMVQEEEKKANGDKFFKTSFATGKIYPVVDTIDEKFWIRPSMIVRNTTSLVQCYDVLTSAFGGWEEEVFAYRTCMFFMENGDKWFSVNTQTLESYVVAKEGVDVCGFAKAFATRAEYALFKNGQVTFTNRFIELCAGFRSLDDSERFKVKNVFELAVANEKCSIE